MIRNGTGDKRNWARHLLNYYFRLQPPQPLPGGVQWLHPQSDEAVKEVVSRFCQKFYDDDHPRLVLLGINPGRFGAGVTGVNFTAPRQLLNNCGISHPFKDQSELSAEFIYGMIEAFGGTSAFYGKCFLGSVCPLGLIADGKNINYYDRPDLLEALEPFIIDSMNFLLQGNVNRKACISIGGEKNFKYLNRLNALHQWFGEVRALPHPRFIMQYRRKEKEQYIRDYVASIGQLTN